MKYAVCTQKGDFYQVYLVYIWLFGNNVYHGHPSILFVNLYIELNQKKIIEESWSKSIRSDQKVLSVLAAWSIYHTDLYVLIQVRYYEYEVWYRKFVGHMIFSCWSKIYRIQIDFVCIFLMFFEHSSN